jgi:hypothetical protein
VAIPEPRQLNEDRGKAAPSDRRRSASAYGRLGDLPELTWEDFDKASRLAQEGVAPSK